MRLPVSFHGLISRQHLTWRGAIVQACRRETACARSIRGEVADVKGFFHSDVCSRHPVERDVEAISDKPVAPAALQYRHKHRLTQPAPRGGRNGQTPRQKELIGRFHSQSQTAARSLVCTDPQRRVPEPVERPCTQEGGAEMDRKGRRWLRLGAGHSAAGLQGVRDAGGVTTNWPQLGALK